jgi:hypothetical protein
VAPPPSIWSSLFYFSKPQADQGTNNQAPR